MKQFIPKALQTAVVVGSVLVTINQYEALFGDASIDYVKLVLTYIVPFMVYMYSAITNSKEQ